VSEMQVRRKKAEKEEQVARCREERRTLEATISRMRDHISQAARLFARQQAEMDAYEGDSLLPPRQPPVATPAACMHDCESTRRSIVESAALLSFISSTPRKQYNRTECFHYVTGVIRMHAGKVKQAQAMMLELAARHNFNASIASQATQATQSTQATLGLTDQSLQLFTSELEALVATETQAVASQRAMHRSLQQAAQQAVSNAKSKLDNYQSTIEAKQALLRTCEGALLSL
jgi:DNA repair exonuclease SbcCD ATPase subunit